MKIQQAYLRSEHNEVMTTWLDVQPKLKLGAFITLKDFNDPETKWEVIFLFDDVREATDFDFHRKWDNNNYDKHEGLNVK